LSETTQYPVQSVNTVDEAEDGIAVVGAVVINPTLESVGEAKVTSQNYDAEFGQAIAGVVSVLTRSGANELDGSAFEYPTRAAVTHSNAVEWTRNAGARVTPFNLQRSFVRGRVSELQVAPVVSRGSRDARSARRRGVAWRALVLI
jgi:hypothetical protein